MPFNKIGFGITTSTLDCGLNIITKRFPGNLVFSGLAVRSGSVYDPPGKSGLAHLLEHCLFDGVKADAVTKQLPLTNDHQINVIVEKEGGTINGLNSYQSVTYVLDFNKRDLGLMLNLLLRVVMLPKLSDTSVNNQKTIVCAELARDMENPLYGDQHSTYFDEFLRSYLFSSNPIRHREGGQIENVLAIRPKMVRDAFNTFYAPNNMALIVLSPFNHREVVELVKRFEKEFGNLFPQKLKKIPKLEPAELKEGKPHKEVRVWTSDNFRHGVINMGYHAPTALHRDHVPIRILSGILGAFTFSRLYHTFREKHGHSYFAESRYFKTTIHGELVIHANFYPKANEKLKTILDDAQEFVVNELKRIRKGEINLEEFEQVKTSLYNYDRKFKIEDPEIVRGFLINAVEANDYTDCQSISKSIKGELDDALRIKNCSLKRFIAAINRQIDPEKYTLLVSAPTGCY